MWQLVERLHNSTLYYKHTADVKYTAAKTISHESEKIFGSLLNAFTPKIKKVL
jgi:hypothetical protein